MMSTLFRTTLLLLLALSSACVSVQVDPLSGQTFEPRAGRDAVTTLQREPNRGYVQIARIVATSEYASEETLRDRILPRRRNWGLTLSCWERRMCAALQTAARRFNPPWVLAFRARRRPVPIAADTGIHSVWMLGASPKGLVVGREPVVSYCTLLGIGSRFLHS